MPRVRPRNRTHAARFCTALSLLPREAATRGVDRSRRSRPPPPSLTIRLSTTPGSEGPAMLGLMMDYPLTLSAIFRRAEQLFRSREIVSRQPDQSLHRYTIADWADRTRRLAAALAGLGVQPGERVATLMWNHGTHLEAYFAIPLLGGVLHTLNLRLHPDELAYIVNHAHDRAVIVDANAWGMPFASVMTGAKQVMPGPHLDPASILDLFERERVTITGGVPTIWIGVLQLLDASPKKYDLSSIRVMFVGGSAVPQALIEAFEKRHGMRIIQAWGMTEMSPLGSCAHVPASMAGAPDDAVFKYRAKQGRPAPFVEIRARSDNGLVPWDGETMGELEVRGPWIAGGYYGRSDCGDRFTPDGWFRTGDIVTIDASGTIQVQDRAKDVIKSGGEWISSVALECALMGHPAVAEAAVIPVDHPKWSERPLAAVVLKPGASASPSDLRSFLAAQFPKFWLPYAFEFIDAIPRTSAGKFKKTELRARFKDYQLAE